MTNLRFMSLCCIKVAFLRNQILYRDSYEINTCQTAATAYARLLTCVTQFDVLNVIRLYD